jgi:hypothetical protein
MPLIQLLEVLIVVGVLLWLVNRFIPMQATIKSILNGVVVIGVVLWLLNVFGLFHSLPQIRIGKGLGKRNEPRRLNAPIQGRCNARHPPQGDILKTKLLLAVGITLGLSAFDSAGWQQNRKMELLVSGEAIAKPVNPTTESLR